jgi:hypothetical protein
MIFYLLILVVLGGLAWIRFAPSDPANWHVDPRVTTDQDLASGVRRRIEGGGEAQMQALHSIILETPRTEVLAGAPQEGRVTYITRSLWLGFPDYTTVQEAGDHLELWARLRFGQSDMGVNKARVEGWLDALQGAQGG